MGAELGAWQGHGALGLWSALWARSHLIAAHPNAAFPTPHAWQGRLRDLVLLSGPGEQGGRQAGDRAQTHGLQGRD